MRYGAYANARPGFMQLLQAAAAPGGRTQFDAMRDLAYLDSSAASARKYAADAGIAEDELRHRRNLPSYLRAIGGPMSEAPEAWAGLAGAGSSLGLRDFTQGQGDLRSQALQEEAAQAARDGNAGVMNRLNAVLAEAQYEPYSANEAGILNAETGAFSPSESATALAAQRRAAAGRSAAEADLARAKIPGAGLINVPAGQSVYMAGDLTAPRPPGLGFETTIDENDVIRKLRLVDTPPAAPQPIVTAPDLSAGGGSGGMDPTTAARTKAEHIAAGIPEPVAHGLAYGTLNMESDPNSLRRTMMHTSAAGGPQVVGVLEGDKFTMTPYGQALYGGAPVPAAARGARAGVSVPTPKKPPGHVFVYDAVLGENVWIPKDDLPEALRTGASLLPQP